MQPAETGLGWIAKIEVVMTGRNRQQRDRRDVRRRAGTRAAGQVHVQRLAVTLQQRRQLPGIALGVSQAFAAAGRAGAGDPD